MGMRFRGKEVKCTLDDGFYEMRFNSSKNTTQHNTTQHNTTQHNTTLNYMKKEKITQKMSKKFEK